ncbi:hypothetical protein [Marinobacter shengliensis]|uniref:hypothetical protein n=1 Tax=Marinobacter shengliensis TaxID=1389223 RepID=UPI001108A9AA|nr:hypothetical protein [Marinobacter shengliensis]
MLVDEFTSTLRSAHIHRIESLTPFMENVVFDDDATSFEFHWVDGESDDLCELIIPRENIEAAYFDERGAICVIDGEGDEVKIECFHLVPMKKQTPASLSTTEIDTPAVARLAYEMATSSNLAFDSGSDYDNDLYSGFIAFKAAAESDPKGTALPDEISPWPENENLTNGELLQRIDTHAAELQALMRDLLSMVKEGMVQAAEHDNLPLDMTKLDVEAIATKGRQYQENESLLADLKELINVTKDHRRVLTDKQAARLKEIITLLDERDVEIPFKVEV